MITYGMVSICWSMSCSPCILCGPRFSSYKCIRRLCHQHLRSYPFLLKGREHFEGNTGHTSTDLHRTSCPLLLLARLQGSVRPICFCRPPSVGSGSCISPLVCSSSSSLNSTENNAKNLNAWCLFITVMPMGIIAIIAVASALSVSLLAKRSSR